MDIQYLHTHCCFQQLLVSTFSAQTQDSTCRIWVHRCCVCTDKQTLNPCHLHVHTCLHAHNTSTGHQQRCLLWSRSTAKKKNTNKITQLLKFIVNHIREKRKNLLFPLQNRSIKRQKCMNTDDKRLMCLPVWSLRGPVWPVAISQPVVSSLSRVEA